MGEKHFWLCLRVLLAIAAVALAAVLVRGGGSSKVRINEESTSVDLVADVAKSKGHTVTVGSYIENLHSLSLRQRIFNAEGFIGWNGPRRFRR